MANLPDIVVMVKQRKKDAVMDVTIPSHGNIRKKEHNELEKY